ncbi:YHYH protein [Colwellia piezophila]|uniref:YHYH protein n=1 Tax=Colwellia piezophila TaxID=211668 RepID=UPI00035CC074|nr:YHYH protein [Colwellia piezophila]
MIFLSTKKAVLVCIAIIFMVSACGGSATSPEAIIVPEPIVVPTPIIDPVLPDNNITKNIEGDISYLRLTNRHPDCAEYVGNYLANIVDVQNNVLLDSYLTVTANSTHCIFSSNNVPNHNVGGNTTTGKDFASAVKGNTKAYLLTIPRFPVPQSVATYVQKQAGMLTLNGILLNGVDLDMDSAFCYHPDINTPLNIGLGTRTQCGLNADWYAVPANNTETVTLDEFSGHAFDGRYHYHGDNDGLSHLAVEGTLLPTTDEVDPSGSPVVGFAPDGYPIYGHYFYDAGTGELRKAKSSWTTYSDERVTPQGSSIDAPSINTHIRGLFVEDWFYQAGLGDLDECNGMTDAYGNYGYYYTETYPFGPLCVKGQPDASFTLDSSAFVGE